MIDVLYSRFRIAYISLSNSICLRESMHSHCLINNPSKHLLYYTLSNNTIIILYKNIIYLLSMFIVKYYARICVQHPINVKYRICN